MRQALRRRVRKGTNWTAPEEFLEAAKRTYFRKGRPGLATCQAVANSTGCPCKRLAAYGTAFCDIHGARRVLRAAGLLRGAEMPFRRRPMPDERTERAGKPLAKAAVVAERGAQPGPEGG
jgi:hypothetical protein